MRRAALRCSALRNVNETETERGGEMGRENVVNVNRHVNGVTATVTGNVNVNVKFTACSNSAALEAGLGVAGAGAVAR